MTSCVGTLKLRFQVKVMESVNVTLCAKQRSSSVIICFRSALKKCNDDNEEEIIHLGATERYIELN